MSIYQLNKLNSLIFSIQELFEILPFHETLVDQQFSRTLIAAEEIQHLEATMIHSQAVDSNLRRTFLRLSHLSPRSYYRRFQQWEKGNHLEI